MRNIRTWAAAAVVLTLGFGGRASGQTVGFLTGFPKNTNAQGQQDGKIYVAGTTQFAQGFSPTVTIFWMPNGGGLIKSMVAPLVPVNPSPPGTMTFSFGTAAQPLNTGDKVPNRTYYVWANLLLTNGTTTLYVSSAWATLAIAQGMGDTAEAGSVTAMGGQNGANQIVGTVAVTITKPYDPNTEPLGWKINGNLVLYGLLSGNPVNPGVIGRNAALATNNQATITITNVPAGKYKLFGTAFIDQPGGTGQQTIGSPLSADYTVAN